MIPVRAQDREREVHDCGRGLGIAGWIDDELVASRFSDVRLGRRLRQLVTQMAGAVGGPIPLAYQDWANTKAAYCFLSNSAVSEGKILQGHFQSTALRVAAVERPILVLQDTTEFAYEREKPEQVGAIGYAPVSLRRRRGARR